MADQAAWPGDRLADWLTANVPSARRPFTVARLAGGNSNLTYRVGGVDDRSWVVRRPPLGSALATAHDVVREARVLRALHGTGVPVPEVIASCADVSVAGAPFVVLEFVDGITCAGADDAAKLSPDQRARAGQSAARVLAALHDVDPDAVGLGQLGRRHGYVERQLTRWHAQWRADQQRPLAALPEAYERLRSRIPTQERATIVHGDYRLDNCILRPDGSVRAVVDWEICALGDPLADLGVLLAYWAEPGDDVQALQDPPTTAPGFATRDELRAAYFAASGHAAVDVSYYVAFAWWKLACIVEGVYARATRTPPTTGRSPQSYADQAARLAEHAWELTRAL